MKKWKLINLSSVALPKKGTIAGGPFGSDLTTKDYVDEGVPVIRGTNLPTDSRFLANSFVFVTEEKADRLKLNCAVPGDVVFTQRGTLGQVGIIPKKAQYSRFLISQSQMKLTVDPKKAEVQFIYYFYKMPSMITYIENHSLQSGVPHINLGIFRKLPLFLPPIETQQKIAAILSANDDLIELNERRIALLEKMAEEFYREWFVRMRFPGYEVTSQNDTPANWGQKKLTEITDIIDCLHTKKPNESPNGPGWLVQLENILEYGRFDTEYRYRISHDDYLEWTKNIELQEGDCLITNVGRIAAIAQIPSGVCAAPGRNMTAVRPKNIPASFLLMFLLSSHMKEEVNLKQDPGAIMNSLNVRNIHKIRITIPDKQTLHKFDTIIRPLIAQRNSLLLANSKCRSTRDRLLGRLMSGALDVEDLDIAFPPSMEEELAAQPESAHSD